MTPQPTHSAASACPMCWNTLEESSVSQKPYFRAAAILPNTLPGIVKHHEKVPYLYVTCTAVPGSSLSQIKATRFGDFSTCRSKQFTERKKFKQT